MNFKLIVVIAIALLLVATSTVMSASVGLSPDFDLDLEEDARDGKTIRFGRTPPRRPIFLGDRSRYDKHPDYEQFLA